LNELAAVMPLLDTEKSRPFPHSIMMLPIPFPGFCLSGQCRRLGEKSLLLSYRLNSTAPQHFDLKKISKEFEF